MRSSGIGSSAAALPLALSLALLSMGCGQPPPASRVPDARAAINRVHATLDCGVGIQAKDAKVDRFGKGGKFGANLLLKAMWPDRLNMTVMSSFNTMIGTLTSDGQKFSLFDASGKLFNTPAPRFYFGPAKTCNLARLTQIPVPGHVLVSLFRGDTPVIKHAPENATIEWSTKGYYVVTINGTRDTVEEIHIEPHPEDRALPWDKQRMRVRDVEVRQQGLVLYRAELAGHRPTETAKPHVDPDGIEPPSPPSGPLCTSDLPRRIHVEVPGKDEDVVFRYDQVFWNPPLLGGDFEQPVPLGVEVVRVTCEGE